MAEVLQTPRFSLGYHFTVTDRNDEQLLAIRKQIINHNKQVRAWARKTGCLNHLSLQVVKLHARGPRKIHAIADGFNARAYDQELPLRYGTSFDVYIYEQGNYELKQELRGSII